jgi:hypothetical protein
LKGADAAGDADCPTDLASGIIETFHPILRVIELARSGVRWSWREDDGENSAWGPK